MSNNNKSNNNNNSNKANSKGDKPSSSQQQKKKQKSAKNKSRQQSRAVNEGMQNRQLIASPVSPAVRAYIKAIVDPFEASPCFVPNIPSLMTRPTKYWSKGTFSTSTVAGANGVGWIVGFPTFGVTNDAGMVVINSAALPTPTIDLTNAANFAFFTSNSDYAVANFGATNAANSVQARVVAFGLRIRNITPALTRGGQCVGLAHPAHASLDTFTVADMDAFAESGRHSGKDLGSWIELTWRPVDSDDTDFFYTFAAPNAPDAGTLGFLAVAPSASPQTYEYEAYGLYEIQGNIGDKAISIADPTGHAAVSNTLVAAQKLHKPHVRDERLPGAAHRATEEMVKKHQSGPGRRMADDKADDNIMDDIFKGVLGFAGSAISSLFTL